VTAEIAGVSGFLAAQMASPTRAAAQGIGPVLLGRNNDSHANNTRIESAGPRAVQGAATATNFRTKGAERRTGRIGQAAASTESLGSPELIRREIVSPPVLQTHS
jgi:hypothetical protein